jgi:hypothetical protein
VTPGRRAAAVLLLAAGLLSTGGCSRAATPAAGSPTAENPVPSPTASAPPTSAASLAALVVTEVPSGLPRMPDLALTPPAGEKTLDDVAAYASDAAEERKVLGDYGFRYGWERFWGTGTDPVTSVFVEQFGSEAGAAAFSADLARNDADHYRAVLHEKPAGFPPGCRLLTVAGAQPDVGLPGPAAFAWCADGVFSVAVTSVAGSADAARDEVATLVATQLARLPG